MKKTYLSNPAPGENLLSGNLVMETGCTSAPSRSARGRRTPDSRDGAGRRRSRRGSRRSSASAGAVVLVVVVVVVVIVVVVVVVVVL